ncbi:N-formylglutamate amidohydrolase [Terrihabitans rhizophilus]|uniref:N-formylglutamate amidohydrolase n=1 Tax=Terrihabitans rhizophilus TaxID=3092662 RepID=A0ABU4RQJ1_9HYPH|nr:N-formylglutamate amidohydrolase [Terrihabitans sp. PJ23]MDX6807124.1 N-formylglutamate amidohydrolase [Terrihabitans sp. PJ23]
MHEPPSEPSSPFEIIEPRELVAPVVLNSPHSGAHYPPHFLASTRLDPLSLRRSEDAFVDELFRPAAELGVPLMRALFPRAFLDLNREAYELDPRMFDGRLPSYANTRSLRVAGGLGTIARIVGDSQEIYAGRLPVQEALHRIETFYQPYHQALARLLGRIRSQFGTVILIDCHSMPSTGSQREERHRADIVLGDRYGTSCSPALTGFAEVTMKGLGLSVSRNAPYAGGYITEFYGRPVAGTHALQIEINRALYMDEKRHERIAGFDALAAKLQTFAEQLIAFSRHEIDGRRVAAE